MKSTNRRVYPVDIVINRRSIDRVIIDPHYELKHSASIHDELILRLVHMLNGLVIPPIGDSPPFQYFRSDDLVLNGKRYRLIWLLENNEVYIGVVNAFRRG